MQSKQTQSHITRFLSLRFIAGLFLLLLVIFVYWHWLSYQAFLRTPINLNNKQTILLVKSGDSISQLSKNWQQNGLIESLNYLKLYYWLNPQLKKIKAGEYQLDVQETPVTLLDKLSKGKVIQHAFTIVEGMNRWQLFSALQAEEKLIYDINQDNLAANLRISQNNIEGWLFPETYHFHAKSHASELIKRAYAKMLTVLNQQWQNRADGLPYESAYQALIMASIIEKETALDSEREIIAGVFVRRLQKNMRLQTDPTVIYGLGKDFNGNITRKDLTSKTAYNTYMINGLPPTPIAMPSERSIYAALHPADGESLYFVADGHGGHYFSNTIEEHNQAVKKYLRTLREKRIRDKKIRDQKNQ